MYKLYKALFTVIKQALVMHKSNLKLLMPKWEMRQSLMDATKQSVTVQCSLIVFTLEATCPTLQCVGHVVTPQSVADV